MGFTAVDGTDVVFLRGDTGTGTAQAVRVNASTGDVISTSREEGFISWPTICSAED